MTQKKSGISKVVSELNNNLIVSKVKASGRKLVLANMSKTNILSSLGSRAIMLQRLSHKCNH